MILAIFTQEGGGEIALVWGLALIAILVAALAFKMGMGE